MVALMAHSRWALGNGKTRSLALSLLASALVLACYFAIAGYVAAHVSRGHLNLGMATGVILGAWSVANLMLGAGAAVTFRGALGRPLAACCVLPILFAVANSDKLLPSFFSWDPSGRTLSEELQRQAIPAAQLNVSKYMNRGQRYSLNFYLHEEIPEWDSEHPHQGYLLIGNRPSKFQAGSAFTFEEMVSFDSRKTGYFLYRIQPPSAAGHPGSGKPQ
jgi:hypothetical protein